MFGIAAQNRGSLNGGFVPKSSEHLGKIIGNYWKFLGIPRLGVISIIKW